MTAFVTGYPSLRARHVVAAALAAEPERDVVALVAKERRAEADAARALLGADERRVELVEGDATALDFGLSGRAYLELAQRVAVVHAAYSVVDPNASDSVAERVNVGAAREAVELARAAEPACGIVFYSSVFVSGNRSGLVREDELEAGQGFRNGAERSLAIAERVLRGSGLPVAVLRAGHLLGDSRTGEVEHLTGPYPLLVLVASARDEVALPLPPGNDSRLPVTPVDYLAALGVHVARTGRFGRTFHVLEPERVTLRRFLELAAERSGKRLGPGFHPGSLTRTLFGNPAARLLPQNVRGILEVLGSSAEYDTTSADELAAEGAPGCPPLTSTLDVLLAHVRERIENGTLSSGRRHPPSFLVA